MELNRETAMRLWNKTYGKATKALDFSLRAIAKGAYGDRNSEFGWNVDHILPVSQGGKTNDSNLIITNIKTNDEKADKFPCFKANEIKFEIIKVQNHYEIREVDKTNNRKKEEDDSTINFFDSAAGINFYKKLKGIQNQPRFVGSVLIRLKNIKNTAVVDFIEKFLDAENISYNLRSNYKSSETRIIAKNYNMPLKEDINALLDKCVLLNTYLSCYFKPNGDIEEFDIHYRVDHFAEKQKMYLEAQKIDTMRAGPIDWSFTGQAKFWGTLLINKLVVVNTECEINKNDVVDEEWMFHNFIYKELAKNLEKEVSR